MVVMNKKRAPSEVLFFWGLIFYLLSPIRRSNIRNKLIKSRYKESAPRTAAFSLDAEGTK